MEIGYVYMITCLVTGKIYVGSTKDLKDRFWYYKAMRCKKQKKLYNSLNKYGFDQHLFEEVWSGDLYQVLQKECIIGNWFEVLDKEKGLNLRLPKIDDIYQHFSDEARENISKAAKNKPPMTEETRLKIVATKKAQGIPQELKAKMEANLPKGKRSKKWKDAISNGHKTKKRVLSENLKNGEKIEFPGSREASEYFNCSKYSIANCCLGTRPSVFGIKFTYLD